MKKIILSLCLVLSFGIFADNHLPENFSKYQSNFLFKCEQGAKCLAAFNKYMNSPEIASQNYEADIYAILHNGWDDTTHGVSFYYKDADEYAESYKIFAMSEAGQKFRKKMSDLGMEQIMQNLTVHTIVVQNSGSAAENGVSLRWSLNVSKPAEFLPLISGLMKSTEKYDWAPNAYGVQTHYLGSNGNGITHEIWTAFSNQQDALAFMDGLYTSKEFIEYQPKADEVSTFIRSYMELSLNMFNPD